MKELQLIIQNFRKAHQVIWKRGIWKYLSIPVGLTILYFPLLVFGCVVVSGFAGEALMHRFFPNIEDGSWLALLLKAMLFLMFGLLGVVTFRGVVMIFYSPFLDHISEKVEEHFVERRQGGQVHWSHMVRRVIIITFLTVLCSVILMAGSLMVSWIPIVGWCVSAFLILPLELFITAIGYTDPFLARNGYGTRRSLKLMFQNFRLVLLFGTVSSLLLFIPLLGWFIAPTYSVIAGVILGMQLVEKSASAIPAANQNP